MKPVISKMSDGRWQCKGKLPCSVEHAEISKFIEATFYGESPLEAASRFFKFKAEREIYA